MSRLRAAALLAVLLLLVATGCTSGDASGNGAGDGSGGVLQTSVDVDTPALRAAKRQADIAACPSAEGQPVEGGLPEVTLPCLGGGHDVALAGLRGPLVVNLFAQWCGPCREELPYYQQLHAQGAVDVLGVDYQDVLPGKALELAKETGVTYPSLADPGGELRAPLRVVGLPRLLMVDEKGKVVYDDAVAIESYAQLADLVEEHLGVPVGPRG
jgi:thiol-disulfide isomerase/thioredoxin